MRTFIEWLNEAYTIHRINPEEDWEQADAVYQIAKTVNIRPSSNKDVSIVALNPNGDVIGGIFSSFEEDPDMSQEAGEPYHQYEFDVVVDPRYQRQGVGGQLIQAAEAQRKELEGDLGRAYTSLQVVNPHLHRYLTQQRGYEVDYEPPEDSNERGFLSRIRKWMRK